MLRLEFERYKDYCKDSFVRIEISDQLLLTAIGLIVTHRLIF